MIFLYIIKWAIIYSLLIYFIHYIYLFFEKNLTTTKTIDTLNLSMKEYDKINNILNANNNKNNKKENNDKINKNSVSSNFDNILPNNNNYDNNQFLEFNNDVSIQNELDDFLSKLNSN
jgi:hypothetical protein